MTSSGFFAFIGFDAVGPAELLVLFAVVLIVVGPKNLPAAARKMGSFMASLRRAADEFKRQLMTMDAEDQNPSPSTTAAESEPPPPPPPDPPKSDTYIDVPSGEPSESPAPEGEVVPFGEPSDPPPPDGGFDPPPPDVPSDNAAEGQGGATDGEEKK